MKAIAPHITVQPIRGRTTIRLATPIIGTKITKPITATIIKPTIQGFKHRLQELKNLFIFIALVYTLCLHYSDKASWHPLLYDEFPLLALE